ncbi:MAG: YchJ family protein [Thermodesulfobacteriota bacterium]
MDLCPCGSGRAYAECCEPYVTGAAPAPTAEALMRSRYSAYAVGNLDHLERTQVGGDWDRASAESWSRNSEWLGLDVLATEAGGPDDETGMVEFSARFALSGVPQEHREIARFGRRDGSWVYLEGDVSSGRPVVRETPKIGRNEPCPCGSGKKYKKCCGR